VINDTARFPPGADERARARRLLLWYPRAWRARYGDEFAELLIDERAELGPSWRRCANVAATGLRARLAAAGLAAHPVDPQAASAAGLAAMACCAAAAAATGGVMWSQLATGLQWSVPENAAITKAIGLLSAAIVMLAVAALLAAAPVAWAVAITALRGGGRRLLAPAAMIAAGAIVLVAGTHHFASSWPGTGGHLLVHQILVPGRVAAFGWAATMSITSYWGHPAALAAFPPSQLAWMVISPAAAGCLLTGIAKMLRRVRMSPRVFRYETCVGHLAVAGLAVSVAGALSWIAAAGDGPAAPFRAGLIDRGALGVLALAAVAATAALRRTQAAGRPA